MVRSLQFFVGSLCAFVTLTSAATVTLDWNVTWVRANPDGMAERPVMGINGQWPLPLLNFTKGDRVVANVHNQVRGNQRPRSLVTRADTSQLGNQSTSIHFHGLFQNGTNEMDGPVGVTQCGIPPGSSFTYNFTIEQPGTYW